MKYLKTTRVSLVSLCMTGLLTACGGGGGGETPSADDGNVTLSGSVFAAPVRGASVSLSDCNGNTVAAAVTSNDDGSYRFSIPASDLGQDLCIEATGGLFDDEATGTSNRQAGRLSAFVAAGSYSSDASVHLTPGSTIIHDLITEYGKSPADSRSLFENTFGYTPDVTVAPTDATNPTTSDKDSQRAGLRAALFSQLTFDLGLKTHEQFAMLEALAQDLSDGVLDGEDSSGTIQVAGTSISLPADILNRYSNAMYNFRNGRENTDLTNAELGSLPFAKMALTDSYKVEYLDGGMMTMEGKSAFTLRISNADGTPASGLAVRLMPMMYMNGMAHGSPVADVVDNGDGTYDASVYYLMASSMMNGMSMGYWKLDVMINGETATFYPDVMMAMGDSVKATLKGQMDMIAGMDMSGGMDMGGDMTMTMENRSYYLFKEGFMMEAGSYMLKLFIAAKESMMSYKAVYGGATLDGGMEPLLVNSDPALTSVEVSTDGGATWTAAMPDGATGIWTVMGLTGLTDGVQAEIHVRLTVNGETKTTDGTAAGGNAIFLLTPGGSTMSMSM
ncbi:MAG TPA: carboxypeptidase regulatory-like domain-containing protein [Thiolapillus brandeum]|uniref:Carboxypeptidase regulatory-like domain-containing protein n=1 Tax=Thiolapillus brandeum TaxID=1076588 RepID=A0A831WC65_9GAMM|nr:carboxypeptidase regulatory-like domain-containing protein [Thiolapillus brandeum]